MLLSFAACNDGQGEETEMTTQATTNEETTTSGETTEATSGETTEATSCETTTGAGETTEATSGETTTVAGETTEATIEETTAAGQEPTDEIAVISPEDNAKLVLANEDVYGWWKNFNWKKTDSSEFYKHADIYYPSPVDFEWEEVEGAEYYRVYLSTHKDMSEAESYLVNENKLTVSTLFTGKTYYWQIDAVRADETVRSSVHIFKTAKSPRTIEVEGVSNTRDAGGYEGIDDRRMKQGMIYRGGKLEGITENGIMTFHDIIGIKTDLDLRTVGEGGAGVKSPLGDDVKYINLDGRYYCGDKGISNEKGKEIIADEIRVFLNPANYPVYIHCSLGRDRTGTIVLLLQGLVGVSKTDIMMDYELSIFSVTGTFDNASIEALRNNIQATYNYLYNSYEGETFAEKVENYLISCGITAEEIQTLRDILLEEAQ